MRICHDRTAFSMSAISIQIHLIVSVNRVCLLTFAGQYSCLRHKALRSQQADPLADPLAGSASPPSRSSRRSWKSSCKRKKKKRGGQPLARVSRVRTDHGILLATSVCCPSDTPRSQPGGRVSVPHRPAAACSSRVRPSRMPAAYPVIRRQQPRGIR